MGEEYQVNKINRFIHLSHLISHMTPISLLHISAGNITNRSRQSMSKFKKLFRFENQGEGLSNHDADANHFRYTLKDAPGDWLPYWAYDCDLAEAERRLKVIYGDKVSQIQID